MFDPKKMMNDAVNQVQKQATDIVQKQATDIVTGNKGSSGTDELIYRMTMDMEDLRRKNQELTDKLIDFERQFTQLKTLINNK
jgi:hypothetical protein